MYDHHKSKLENFLANEVNKQRIRILENDGVTVNVLERADGGVRIELYEGKDLLTDPLYAQREWDIWWSGRLCAPRY